MAFVARTLIESVFVKETISAAQVKEAEQNFWERIQTKNRSANIFTLCIKKRGGLWRLRCW